MSMLDLIKSRRTIRFFQQRPVSSEILTSLIDAARCAPSGANRQPCEYVIIDDSRLASKLFEHLAWAGYVKPRRNPPAGKRPVAYIVVLTDTSKSPETACPVDAAAAIENILISAWSLGIGSCWLGAINRPAIKHLLNVPEGLDVDSVVALGFPDESPIMEDMQGDSVQYYLDDHDQLHVPKRPLKQITSYNGYGQK